MDKIVRRVTRVDRGGQHHEAKVVYENDEDSDDEAPRLGRFERSVRHMLKAQIIAAQEAYQRHVESAEKGGNAWLREAPQNFMKARRKAMKEMRKAAPFKVEIEEDDED
jgi:Family of unknown function (DUF6312)